jgi:hypothetical protein
VILTYDQPVGGARPSLRRRSGFDSARGFRYVPPMRATLLMIAVLALSAGAASAESTNTRSFYDSRGSFADQSFTRGNSTSFSDGQGRFSGSAIRNSNGTTSFYDGRGRFTGSSVSTNPRR